MGAAGAAGPAGPEGAAGAPGSARAYATVLAPDGAEPELVRDRSLGFEGVKRMDVGVLCLAPVADIDLRRAAPVVSVDLSGSRIDERILRPRSSAAFRSGATAGPSRSSPSR